MRWCAVRGRVGMGMISWPGAEGVCVQMGAGGERGREGDEPSECQVLLW